MTHSSSGWSPDAHPWVRCGANRHVVCPFCGCPTAAAPPDDISDDPCRVSLSCSSTECAANSIAVIALDAIAHPTEPVTRHRAVTTLGEALDLIASLRSHEKALRASLRGSVDTAMRIGEDADAIVQQSGDVAAKFLALSVQGEAFAMAQEIAEQLVSDETLSMPQRVTPRRLAEVTSSLTSIITALACATDDDVAQQAVGAVEALYVSLSERLSLLDVSEFTCEHDDENSYRWVDAASWFLREEMADFTEESEQLHCRLERTLDPFAGRLAGVASLRLDAMLSRIGATIAALTRLRTALATSIEDNCAYPGSVDTMPNAAGALLELNRLSHFAVETRLVLATLRNAQ